MDLGVVTSIIGTVLTLVALAVGLGWVLQRLDEHDRRFDRIDTELQAVHGDVTNLRIDVARLNQKVDDHVTNDAVHR